MSQAMGGEIRFVSLCGMLGYGYPPASLETAMQAGAEFIGVDAGSTDPGPYYLGSGTGFVKPMQVKRDLEPALCAAISHGTPLIIGSAGGGGAAPHVDAFLDILGEIAREQELHFRLAVIHADIAPATVLDALAEGRIGPCGPSGALTAEAVRSCERIVAQMGTGPIIAAVEGGADVIIAGRSCDTAIFAALPIMRGFDPALAFHAAKIAECGTLCARPGGANDSLLCALRDDDFIVTPANSAKRCYPDSVAAHSLYEQPDPNCFYEPEGMVDMSECRFEQLDERSVRVSGTRLVVAAKPTIKLEGAALRGYRAITVAGLRDPGAIAHIAEIEAGVCEAVSKNFAGDGEAGCYTLRFLRYGLDGVMGELEVQDSHAPHEVGVVIEAIAPTQEVADSVLSLARSTALHYDFEGRKCTAGNLAFPFSPSDFQAGPVYEFAVYHLMETDNPDELFPLTFEEV
jgi:hypothetical protein